MIQFNEAAWRPLLSPQRQRQPTLVEGALSASSQDLWPAFIGVCRAKKHGHPDANLRFYLEQIIDGAYVYAEVFDPTPFLPEEAHDSFQEYAAFLQQKLKGQRFGLIVNNVHLFDFEFWQSTRSFFDKVYQKRGCPTGGASFDLFFGNYHRTPFGIHKDDQDVYTWVLEGNKRFHLWPLERLSGRPELSLAQEGLEKKGAKIRVTSEEEYQQLLRESLVLDAKPGDVMFWPASYWHCADNPEGSLALTVGPGIVFEGNLVATKTQGYWEDVFLFDPNDVTQRKNKPIVSKKFSSALKKLAQDEQIADFQKELAKSYLAAQTGSFYFNVPAALELKEISEGTMIQGDTRAPIRWLALSKTTWVISSNGHATALSAPASILQKLEGMFSRVNRGEPKSAAALVAAFSGRAGHAREAALGLLALFVSWRAAKIMS